MKITKEQLKRIIKEQIEDLVHENTDDQSAARELANSIQDVLDNSHIPGVSKGPTSKSYGFILRSTHLALTDLIERLNHVNKEFLDKSKVGAAE